jgi:hypothetical protein
MRLARNMHDSRRADKVWVRAHPSRAVFDWQFFRASSLVGALEERVAARAFAQ